MSFRRFGISGSLGSTLTSFVPSAMVLISLLVPLSASTAESGSPPGRPSSTALGTSPLSLVGEWTTEIKVGGDEQVGRCVVRRNADDGLAFTCTMEQARAVAFTAFLDESQATVKTKIADNSLGGPREPVRLELVVQSDGQKLNGWQHSLTPGANRHYPVQMRKLEETSSGRSTRFALEARLETFVFTSGETFKVSSDVKYDLTGRQTSLSYKVDPIILLSLEGQAAFRTAYLDMPLILSAGYKTSRLFGAKGEVSSETTGPLKALGADLGVFTDVFAFLASLYGFSGRVVVARFAPGLVIVKGPRPGQATLNLERFEGEVRYTGHPIRHSDTAYGLALRLEDLSLPRILYEFEANPPDQPGVAFKFVRESPVQVLRSRSYSVEAFVRWDIYDEGKTGVSFPLGFTLSYGLGPMRYTMDPKEGEKSTIFGGPAFGFIVGGKYKLFDPADHWPLFSALLLYQFRWYGYRVVGDLGNNRSIQFSTDDIYHMATISLAAGF